MKEFFEEAEGVSFADFVGFMGGEVTEFVDDLDFWEEARGEVVFEGLFVDECAEGVVFGVVVGEAEIGVVVVEPVDGLFEGETGVEAASSGGNEDDVFSLLSMAEDFREAGF